MIKTYPSCCSRRSWQARFTTFFFFFFSISFHEIKAQRLVAEIAEKVELEGMTEDYGKLEKELEKASPLAIINEALQKFIDCSAISFRPAFPWQHERGGRRWWEEGKVMERGLHEGNIESEDAQISEHMNGAVSLTNANDPIADVHSSQNLTSLSRAGEEIIGTFKNRTGAWLDVLYAPWRHFFQAMESSYAKLVDAEVKTGKFRVDGEHRAFANQKLQLRIFTTTVIFPGSKPIKYSSGKRDVHSQLAFVSSLQW